MQNNNNNLLYTYIISKSLLFAYFMYKYNNIYCQLFNNFFIYKLNIKINRLELYLIYKRFFNI